MKHSEVADQIVAICEAAETRSVWDAHHLAQRVAWTIRKWEQHRSEELERSFPVDCPQKWIISLLNPTFTDSPWESACWNAAAWRWKPSERFCECENPLYKRTYGDKLPEGYIEVCESCWKAVVFDGKDTHGPEDVEKLYLDAIITQRRGDAP